MQKRRFTLILFKRHREDGHRRLQPYCGGKRERSRGRKNSDCAVTAWTEFRHPEKFCLLGHILDMFFRCFSIKLPR